MIDVSTIGMVVIFLMAFGIVSWQEERVRKAEDALEVFSNALDVACGALALSVDGDELLAKAYMSAAERLEK
jgi:hypothetical protein